LKKYRQDNRMNMIENSEFRIQNLEFRMLSMLSAVKPVILILLTTIYLHGKEPDFSFTLQDLEGNMHKLEDYRGKVVVVDFWAMWCATCYPVFPVLNQLKEQFPRDKLMVIGISIDKKKSTLVKNFASKAQIQYLVLHDQTEKTVDRFKVEALPSLFIFGPDGSLAESINGFKAKNEKDELFRLVEKLLPESKPVAEKPARKADSMPVDTQKPNDSTPVTDSLPLPEVDTIPPADSSARPDSGR
jgi:thiol-disulfide isomerase/thioredoxin